MSQIVAMSGKAWQMFANGCRTTRQFTGGRNGTLTATEGAPMARPGLAWTVLGVGVIAHALTVMQRTSLTLRTDVEAPGSSW